MEKEIKDLADKALFYSLVDEAYEATCERVREITDSEQRLDVSLGVQIFLGKLLDVSREEATND